MPKPCSIDQKVHLKSAAEWRTEPSVKCQWVETVKNDIEPIGNETLNDDWEAETYASNFVRLYLQLTLSCTSWICCWYLDDVTEFKWAISKAAEVYYHQQSWFCRAHLSWATRPTTASEVSGKSPWCCRFRAHWRIWWEEWWQFFRYCNCCVNFDIYEATFSSILFCLHRGYVSSHFS